MTELSFKSPKTSSPKGGKLHSHKAPCSLRPASSPADHVLNLQRTIGNRAVMKLIESGKLQAKLKIGRSNDRYEQEADRVADQVMRMPDTSVQRECSGCEEEIQTKLFAVHRTPLVQLQAMEDEEKEEHLQVKESRGSTNNIAPSIESQINSLRGGGRPLSKFERSFFEPRFERDFSNVRLHTGSQATKSTKLVNARAYTMGRDVVFGMGEYSPHKSEGLKLLAHELVHTIHQGSGSSLITPRLMRKEEDECSDVKDSEIENVVVQQEIPQTATIHWEDGTVESDICSTGKGTCCVPKDSPSGVGATVGESRADGSNWTPIAKDDGYKVYLREADHRGTKYWTEFNKRHIALHKYTPVDGTPLSHGCVRLREDFAKKIYCGSREKKTRVQVRGYARPDCEWPNLITEWRRDFSKAGAHLDGEETDPETQRRNRTSYKLMKRAFGQSGKDLEKTLRTVEAETDSFSNMDAVSAAIPRCGSKGVLPTREEQRLYDIGIPRERLAEVQPHNLPVQTPFPVEILAKSGFDELLIPFTYKLRDSKNFTTARKAVKKAATGLWNKAKNLVQDPTSPVRDDRPLYWARLEMMRVLRQWEPPFTISDELREDLLQMFERSSRGMESIEFTSEADVLKILITGFDPFFLDQKQPGGSIENSNPSGSVVMALDGTTISIGSLEARIEGVIFPVRYRDFDQGLVEKIIGPYIKGPKPVDMVMTISQGGDTFELEKFAGRRRFIQSDTGIDYRRDPFVWDNMGRVVGLHWPEAPRDLFGETGVAGKEFRKSSLPMAEMQKALENVSITVEIDTHVLEVIVNDDETMFVRTSPLGPTPGSFAVKGSGGGFLSNEISYRTLRLRDTSSQEANRSIPVGHLHIPKLTGKQEAHRKKIIDTVKQILLASLPLIRSD